MKIPQNRHHQDTQIPVTFFPDRFAMSIRRESMSLADLKHLVEAPQLAASKDELPFIKLAGFGQQLTKKKCWRSNANVLFLSGVEADLDEGDLSFEKAALLLEQANVLCLMHTTASHTREKPRYRVLLPFSHLVSEDMQEARNVALKRLERVLGTSIARESYVLSQSYYIGRVQGREYTYRAIDGVSIDMAGEFVGWPNNSRGGPIISGVASHFPHRLVNSGYRPDNFRL